MPTTSNKGLSVQSATSNAGTWGAGASHALNEGVIEPIDLMLGGLLTKTLSNVNVTLSATEIQYAMVRLNGVMTGNVQVTSANIGFYMVENVTSGSFAVTWTNGVGSPVTIDQSHRYLLFADATNGVRIISNVDLTGLAAQFASGTVSIFIQAAAPTGWSISSSFNNYAIQLNASGGGGTAGIVDFSTLFARTSVDNYTLTTTDIPAHTHTGSGTTSTESALHFHSYSSTTSVANTDHSHTFSGTTSGQSLDHSHKYSRATANGHYSNTSVTEGARADANQDTGPTSNDHTHSYSGTTSGQSNNHQHTFSGDTGTESAVHTHTYSFTTSSTGGGGAHTHAVDMRLKYAIAIPCTKT